MYNSEAANNASQYQDQFIVGVQRFLASMAISDSVTWPSRHTLLRYVLRLCVDSGLQTEHVDLLDDLNYLPYGFDAGINDKELDAGFIAAFDGWSAQKLVALLMAPFCVARITEVFLIKTTTVSTPQEIDPVATTREAALLDEGDFMESSNRDLILGTSGAGKSALSHFNRGRISNCLSQVDNGRHCGSAQVFENSANELTLAKLENAFVHRLVACDGLYGHLELLRRDSPLEWQQLLHRVNEILVRSRFLEGAKFANYDTEFHILLECDSSRAPRAHDAWRFISQHRDVSLLFGELRDCVWHEHLSVVEMFLRDEVAEGVSRLEKHARNSFNRWTLKIRENLREYANGLFLQLADCAGVLVVCSVGVIPVEWLVQQSGEGQGWSEYIELDLVCRAVVRGAKIVYVIPSDEFVKSSGLDAFADVNAVGFESSLREGCGSMKRLFWEYKQRLANRIADLFRVNDSSALVERSLLMLETSDMAILFSTRVGRSVGIYMLGGDGTVLTQRERWLRDRDAPSSELSSSVVPEPWVRMVLLRLQEEAGRAGSTSTCEVMRQSLREISFEIKRQLYTGLKGWKYFPDSVAVAWWLDGTESWISARSRQRTCAKMFRMAEHFGMPEGLEFALIPPGRKVLNCSVNDSVAVNLVVSEPFYLSVRPMSVLQCKKMFGYGEPASIDEGEGDHRRVAVDPWLEVRSTIRWLNSRYGELGFRFWLPTEQEWEYVSSVAFSANAGSAEMINSEVGVGAESAVVTNALGIVFLYGSVWEWCSEMFEGDQSGLQQPRQESTGVLRGMTWSGTEVPCRSARRYTMDCVSRPSDVRFRIACVPHALDGK